MAKMLLTNDANSTGCYRVYLDDTEFSTANIRQEDYDIHTITEDQMNDICEGKLTPVKTNNVLSWITVAEADLGTIRNQLSDVNPGQYEYMIHLDGLKTAYKDFLDSNPNHSRYAEVNSAYNALPQYSTLVNLLPLNTPLWKSLKDNGYPLTICPLRLP